MTRLNRILLTGTILPALVLTPIAGAFAQVPGIPQRDGQERQQQQPQRQAPPAAPHAPMAPQGGGGMRAAPPAMRAQEAPRAPAAPAIRAPEAPRLPTPPRAVERAAPPREAPAHAEAPTRVAPPSMQRAPDRAERQTERAAPPTRVEKPTEHVTPAEKAEKAAPAERKMTPTEAPTRAEKPAPANREAQPTAPPARTPANANARPDADRSGNERANGNPAARPGAPAGQADRQPPASSPNNMPQPAARAGQPGFDQRGGPNGQQGNRGDRRDRGGISPGGAAAIGAAAGFAGGFLAATGARDLAGIRSDRRESVEDGRTYIREPGRTIVEDGDRSYIVHDENDRFRQLGYDVHREQRGRDFVDTVDRPDGTQIITYTTPDGRMLRRVRRARDGREYVLIDNSYDGGVRSYQDDVVDLPPPPIGIPRDRYAVDYADVDEGVIYDTFAAPPLQAPPRRYTLDQIRYSPDIRRYVRSVDINTINFDSGSWIVPGAATGKLEALATAIKRTLSKNPNSVFLVEGFTDATGNPTDNLSLSDRRAQSVAAILTKDFNVPPENLTTQGYGQQNLKVNTQGPSLENRRVVVQNITPLLAAGGQPPR